jgi:hypothetical protein
MKIELHSIHRTELLLIVFCGLFASINPAFAQSWTQAYAAVNGFDSVASSADGTRLVAVSSGGSIYFSTNSGVNWTSNSVSGVYFAISVASSANGAKLAALAFFGGIPGTTLYTSTNVGIDWMSNSIPSRNLIAVASSADGNKLVAVVGATPTTTTGSVVSGPIFTSTNSGTTWITNNVPPSPWTSVASSADGSKLVATSETLPIYTSANSGASWMSNNVPNNVWWTSVASSADGAKLVASVGFFGATNSGIYTLYSSPSPPLNITTPTGNVGLSWIVPSTNFVLQQSSDLIAWVDLTNTPTLNLTNLNNELVLSPTNSNGFYRLATP